MKTNWMFCLLLTALLSACGSDSEPKDTDKDSIADKSDNCVNTVNTDQLDLDGDGIGDACDDDIDGDNVNNTEDAFPRDILEYLDTDGDTIGDNTDNCPAVENLDQANMDGDRAGDVCDDDIDGDNVNNTEDAFPRDISEYLDTDGDTIGDNTDNCQTVANLDQANADNDSAGDACDDLPNDASDTKDFDGDLIGDTLDPDDDNDTYNDGEDAFPYDATEWADVDGDNVGDNKDLHLDNKSQNAYQLNRLLEEGKAIRFIAPGPESDRFGDHFGKSVTNAGDVNGDDLDDLLIGFAAYEDNGQRYGGIVILLFGQEGGWPDEVDFSDIETSGLDYLIIRGGVEDNFGYALGRDVSAVGDMNNDGYDEFIIGASAVDYDGNVSAGEAYLVFGQASFSKNDMTIDEIKQDYAITYYGVQLAGILGTIVESLGDVNNDTYPDFLIGELQHNITEGGKEGRSFIVFGGDHLVPPADSTPILIDPETLATSEAVQILNTPRYLSEGNARILGIGDFNADGYDDIAFAREAFNKNGEVAVIWGRHKDNWASPINLDALGENDGISIIPVIGLEDNISHSFGFNLAVGDMNGNGHKDLIISSLTFSNTEGFDENRIYILYGGRQAWPSKIVATEMASDIGTYIKSDESIRFGYSMAVLPDANGDGSDELLASATKDYDFVSGNFNPLVYRINGRENWSNLVVSKENEPVGYEFIESPGTVGFGENVAVVGDYNQDGLAEYVIDDLFTVEEYEGQPSSEQKTHFFMFYGEATTSHLDEAAP